MATIFYTLVLLIFSNSFLGTYSLGVGINYGQIGNNLPSPSRVSILLGSLNISRVKLYDADPNVLTAFANTNVEFIIGLGNEYLQKMQDPQQAQIWIQQKVQPYIAQTRITCITVGNEVLGGVDPQLPAYLVPAMKAMYQALVNLGLSSQVYVTTAHSLQILKTSFPPSSGAFRDDLIQYIQPILAFHAQSNSPFLINAYPYFAYKSDPKNVQIEYLLFEPNSGSVDPGTNLKYDNMLYAQIDAVYSGMKALGHSDVQVRISETGWPSKGDVDEPGATVQNAGIYNRNLLQRMQQGQGTPAHPSQHIDIYVFALFNENMKPGPTSERNYGLYYPDGTPVYNLGVQGYLPLIDYSSSKKNMDRLTNFATESSKIPLKGQSLEGEALCGYTELRASTPSRITENLTTAPPMIFGLIILFLALAKTYMYSAYQHAFCINLF